MMLAPRNIDAQKTQPRVAGIDLWSMTHWRAANATILPPLLLVCCVCFVDNLF